MNSNFPIGDLVCGPPPKRAVAAAPERARTSAPSLRKSVVAWLLFASCCVGAAGRSFGRSASQSGAQTGTQSPGAMTNEAPAQPAASSPMPIANQAMLYPGEDFTLSAGDLIAVAVFMQSDYTATVRLKLDGTAELPLIGSVPLQERPLLAGAPDRGGPAGQADLSVILHADVRGPEEVAVDKVDRPAGVHRGHDADVVPVSRVANLAGREEHHRVACRRRAPVGGQAFTLGEPP